MPSDRHKWNTGVPVESCYVLIIRIKDTFFVGLSMYKL